MTHLLCKRGAEHHEWYAISASADRAALEAEAQRLNLAEYEADEAAWQASDKTGPRTMALDDPARRGYRTFYVSEVPDWPGVESA